MRVVVLVVLIASPVLTGCASYHAAPLEAPRLETAYRARTLDNTALRAFVETDIGSTQPIWPLRALI